MLTIAIFNLVVVIIAYLAYLLRSVRWLQLSFFLIFLFLALRYDFGNDYQNYLVGFGDVNAFNKLPDFEPGWVLLCRLFNPVGFFAMVAVLAAFNCIVYYQLIKKYVPPAYYWFAVFLYVFNADMMLIHSSAMRQSVAIAIFVYAFDFLYKKNYLRYFLCIAVAAFFHSSALILFPIFILGAFNWKVNRIAAVTLFAVFVLVIVFVEFLAPYIGRLVYMFFEQYSVYQTGADSRIGTGLAFVFRLILFALVLVYAQFQTGAISLLFKIGILALFVEPFGFDIVMISRMGMYFQPALLAVIPLVIWNIKGHNIYRTCSKCSLVAAYIVITLYSFYGFFQSEVWRDRFGTYKTIFSAPEIY